MITVPRFKFGTRIELVEPDSVFIIDEQSRSITIGSVPYRLAQLIDGVRSTDEIVDNARAAGSLEEIYFHLFDLDTRGAIEECPRLSTEHRSRPLDACVARVSVIGPSVSDVQYLRALLGERGLDVSEDGSQCEVGDGLLLVAADDYLASELASINRRMIAASKPWMLAKATGSTAWIGPLFVPGQTGCWECLAERLRAHRVVDEYLYSIGRAPAATVEAVPTLVHEAFRHLVADQFIRAIGGGSSLKGQVLTIASDDLASQRHSLQRLPHCPSCGDPEHIRRAGPQPLTLTSRPVSVARRGRRVRDSEDTLARLETLISPITGIVGEVRKMPAANRDEAALPASYSVRHSFVRKYENVQALIHTLQNVSGGKGRTDTDARVSGICEAVERYCGLYRGDELSRRARYRELDVPAVRPADLMQFSDRQYRERKAWNSRHSHHQFVPESIDDEAQLAWTPAWSLRDHRHVMLPTAYVYYGYATLDCRSIYADSNGCAAGNCIEEAILQGFFELAERDAVAIWWYNRLRYPALDLASFRDPLVEQLQEGYARIGREIWALDLTNDLGIPVFAALSRRVDADPEDIIFGFGAHQDPRIALERAVCELHQCLPCVARSSTDGPTEYRFLSRDATRWWREARVDTHPYLLASPGLAPRSAETYAYTPSCDLKDEVEQCVARVAELGMDLLVVDQTRLDIGLSVAKVVVPGLRHFWARFAKGRLFDVPVRLGQLGSPKPEEQLNPYPMFL
jgi:oxazoline/thiazoline synthase